MRKLNVMLTMAVAFAAAGASIAATAAPAPLSPATVSDSRVTVAHPAPSHQVQCSPSGVCYILVNGKWVQL